MDRRNAIQIASLFPLLNLSTPVSAWDTWGQSSGYPYGVSAGLNRGTNTRVGNYSGGYEKIYPYNTIKNRVTVLHNSSRIIETSLIYGAEMKKL